MTAIPVRIGVNSMASSPRARPLPLPTRGRRGSKKPVGGGTSRLSRSDRHLHGIRAEGARTHARSDRREPLSVASDADRHGDGDARRGRARMRRDRGRRRAIRCSFRNPAERSNGRSAQCGSSPKPCASCGPARPSTWMASSSGSPAPGWHSSRARRFRSTSPRWVRTCCDLTGRIGDGWCCRRDCRPQSVERRSRYVPRAPPGMDAT